MSTNRSIDPSTTLTIKQLRRRYQEAFGTSTTSRNRTYLLRALAKHGTSASPVTDIESSADDGLASEKGSHSPFAPAKAGSATPPVGTKLRKTWRGKRLVVTVLADGFRLNGVTYRSLSAAATALCGGNRNGLLFFGLKKCQEPSGPVS